MSVQSVNINTQETYSTPAESINVQSEQSASIFEDCNTSNVTTNTINTNADDDFSTQYEPKTREEKLAYIYSNFKETEDSQGIIGKAVSGVKNLFETENSPENIAKAIQELDENSTDEEIQAVMDKLNDYKSNQEKWVSGIKTGVGITAGVVGAFLLPAPGLGILLGLGVGKILSEVEGMTDRVQDNSIAEAKFGMKMPV